MLRDALAGAAAEAKQLGLELELAGDALALCGRDDAARATLRPRLRRAMAEYDQFGVHAQRLRHLLDNLGAG
jgi:Na+-transporting NADH:ubiquinone oxidoreductase subunit NqrA